MADLIKLLPDNIANQIAAGEVVQRPASVVKELLENAIDAGASSIRLIVKDAGKTLIQVVDDGIGMSETDARMSFERHATSKIRKTDDLFSIKTKGFRGEAMASIAAIAQVEMRTKKHDQELGTQIIIEGSKIKRQEPCQTTAGTSIAVKNIFYNVPARRNFLKSNRVEMKHIINEFQHVALAHPDIFFSLHHNNDKMYHLPKANLRQRIVGVLGNKVNKSLIPIEEDTDVLKVYGFIGKPEAVKKTRGEQFFFVNNRFIRSGYLNHSLLSAYDDLLPPKTYPLYVVFFEIDPAKIDVNVHPTKQEIKFEDERLVYNYLKVTARHALAQHSITPSLDFDVETSITKQLHNLDHRPSEETHNTFQSKANTNYSPPKKDARQKSNLKNWEKLYEHLNTQEVDSNQEDDSDLFSSSANNDNDEGETFASKASASSKPPQQNSKQLYQLHRKYIVSPIKSGFLLIAQNGAHQRVMYERYLQLIENQTAATQKLLFPKTIECSVSDTNLIKSILPNINQLGIDIKEFGKSSFVVHGLPPELSQADPTKVIHQLLEQFKINVDMRLEVHDSLARSLAKQAAIKTGEALDQTEMQQLVDELFGCEVPFRTPSGHKTFISVELDELASRFE